MFFLNKKFGEPINAAHVSNPPANKNSFGNWLIDSIAAGKENSDKHGKYKPTTSFNSINFPKNK